MSRLKVFIYLVFFLVALQSVGQIDSVRINLTPDISTYRVNCVAEKATFGADTTFSTFVIADTSGYTFDWGGTKEPQEDGFPTAKYEFADSGTYTFTVSVFEKSSGSTFTASRNYRVRDIIRVPNVFTPNGDNENDYFIVSSSGEPDKPLEISVYSKTGTLVFTEKAPVIVWDGRDASGLEASEGIYYYILNTSRPDDPVKKGFFYLYRNK